MGILVTWCVTSLSLYVASKLLDGLTLKGGVVSHLFVAGLFGILNALLGYAIYLVLGIVTLGIGFLVSFVTHLAANALVLQLVDSLTRRLSVKNFKTAFLASLVMSVTASVAELVLA